MTLEARTGAAVEPRLHLRPTPSAVLIVLAGVALGLVVTHVLGQARSVLALFTAAATGALLIDPPVELFSRYMRRWMAIVVTLFIVVLGYGALNFAFLGDLDHELSRLQQEAPEAAARIEHSQRFGEAARKFHLRTRVEQAVANLKSRTTKGRAQKAARRFGSYFVGAVLMLFLLSWGPRYGRAFFEQIGNHRRRARLEQVVFEALRSSRRYLLLAIGQAAGVGLVSYAACWIAGLPGPTVLALLVALGSLLPYFGVVIGGVPAMLVAAGFASPAGAWTVVVTLFVLQALQIAVVQPRVTEKVLYAGPAFVLVTFLVGYELYGLGGGLYGYALAIFGLALTDALAHEPVYAPSGAKADA